MNRALITQDDFLAILEARPEMKRALHAAVAAIIELRREAAKNKTGLLAQLTLKRKGVSAVSLTNHFISGFVYDGLQVSEAERETIRGWVLGAADFQMAELRRSGGAP
jgi:hypothetical protein